MENPFWSDVGRTKTFIMVILANVYIGFFWIFLYSPIFDPIVEWFERNSFSRSTLLVIVYAVLYWGLFGTLP